MSIYSNVSEQDLINLRKLAEQQKNERAPKIKNRILKQTHDVKLAQSLSPITKKLDEIKETTQNLGDVIKENNTPLQAMENTPSTHQPIENNEGAIYDVELENTLNNMKSDTGFFNTHYDRQRGWMLNGYPVKILSGSKVEINDKEFNITPNLQKVFTQTSNVPQKKLNDQEWEIYKDILKTFNFENYKPKSGENKSGSYKYSKSKLKGEGIQKIIIPSNVIDIYTRLEILLGLKLSGHTDTLTEASSLIYALYKQGEIQNKQQYKKVLDKFTT